MKKDEKAAVRLDLELEEGILPIGRMVHLTTVTFAYRGKLVAVTPSFYVLEDAVNVFETGALKDYMKTGKGVQEEALPNARVLVERGANTASWVFP